MKDLQIQHHWLAWDSVLPEPHGLGRAVRGLNQAAQHLQYQFQQQQYSLSTFLAQSPQFLSLKRLQLLQDPLQHRIPESPKSTDPEQLAQ